MTKTDLVSNVAKASGVKKADVEKVLNAFVSEVENAVADGEKVQLIGFGTFEAVERSARTGRNPQTGETIEIAARKAPKFTAGKAFKDALN